MAKNRIKHLTLDSAKELRGFDETVRRIKVCESDIKSERHQTKEPNFLNVYFHRRKRAVYSVWGRGESEAGRSLDLRSESDIPIAKFLTKHDEPEELLAKLLVEKLAQWVEFFSSKKPADHGYWWMFSTEQRPVLFVYPPLEDASS